MPERQSLTPGECLAFFRERKGLKRRDVAATLGVHRSTVRRWEQDQCEIGIVHWLKLDRFLEMGMHFHAIDGPHCPTDIDLRFPKQKRPTG